jgi:Heavy-metal-associated domain.
MKVKFLAGLGLSAVLLVAACGGGSNTNTNANTTNTNTTASTPIPQTNESATLDAATKSKVESALKAKGFTDVTVDTTTSPATLRGTVAKGKMAEALQTAMEAAGKPFSNQLTEK